jgi:hypothetical protein
MTDLHMLVDKGLESGHKRMTRPGGQPGGSSYTGRWGGWALAPNTASTGRDFRSPANLVVPGAPNVQREQQIFLDDFAATEPPVGMGLFALPEGCPNDHRMHPIGVNTGR